MAGVIHAERALRAIMAHCKNHKTAKLIVSTEGGTLKVNLEENFTSNDVRREVPAGSQGAQGPRRRGKAGPSHQRRKERRAAERAAAERTAAEKAASAEKAANAAAAAKAAAAEKAAVAEKAAAAEMAAGDRAAEEAAGPRCTKCHCPVKGHPRPTGERCAAAAPLPSPERARGPGVAVQEKQVTPVKGEQRAEDCPCCGGSLTPEHMCDDSDASVEDVKLDSEEEEDCVDFTCSHYMYDDNSKECFKKSDTSFGRCWCD
jgi:hypothetical protein